MCLGNSVIRSKWITEISRLSLLVPDNFRSMVYNVDIITLVDSTYQREKTGKGQQIDLSIN